MTTTDLYNALSGLHAYDIGATDSGIHDEDLRQRVKGKLRAQPDKGSQLLTGYLRNLLADPGYRIEDVASFLEWLRDEMGVYLW